MAVISAAAFGTLAILGKYAYASGLSVAQLLSIRFVLAAGAMLAIGALFSPVGLRIGWRQTFAFFALGACGYGIQSAMFFAALVHLPASFVELLLYASPALIVVVSWGLLKHAFDRYFVAAVLVNFIGVALLIGRTDIPQTLHLLLALAVPVANTAYFLVAEMLMRDARPLPASSIVISGAAAFWVVVAVSRGELTLPSSSQAWLVIACFVIGPSMIAIPLMFGAIGRIGSARTALISTVEPIVTILLAVSLLGEVLTPVQVIGAVLILGSVSVLQWAGHSGKTFKQESEVTQT
jgi:drug/metabolite transporter (DMT)-like permease